jgi:hypothetical protein
MSLAELLVAIGKFASWFVASALGAGVGAYISSYLKKKGENLATHEDIDKLIDQVSAVTKATKQIEATISNETWQRERRAELQLKLIDSVNELISDYLQRSIADAQYEPTLEWFSSFSAVDAAVKALFDVKTYATFKNLEIRIAPGMNEGVQPKNLLGASVQFVEARDAALKAMYGQVIGS